MAVTECSLGDSQCEIESVCSIGHHWQRINRAIRGALNEVTLADLASPADIPLPRIDLRRRVGGRPKAHEHTSADR
jgi:DNA-binding IscR family transcriptional regulator